MRLLAVALATTALAFPQVAKDANAGYKTPEARANVAKSLGGEDRDARQHPTELIAALGIKPGNTVVDLGTGIGYMLPFLSQAVGAKGKVIAQDIFPDFLSKAKANATVKKLANVEFVEGTDQNPNLPAGAADLVLTLDAYHHFDYPDKMLAGIAKALKPGGRFALVDYYKRKGAMGGPDSERALTHIRLDEADVVKEIEGNGFKLIKVSPFLPGVQYLAIFQRK